MKNGAIGGMLFGLSALVLAAPAGAFTSELFSGASMCSTSNAGTTSSSRHCTNGGVDVTARAHAFTGNPSDTVLQSAILGVYTGGLGVTYVDGGNESTSAPQHAMDNDGRFEMILLSFLTEVRLTEVWTKWVRTDADITVLAHTGAGSIGASNPNTLTAGGLVSIANGWELVGGQHYNGPDEGAGNTDTSLQKIILSTPANVSSLHWLIGAYNNSAGFGGSANGADIGSNQYDYLKLYAVVGNTPGRVPEPGGLPLLGIALAGLWGMRRAACS